MRRYLWFLVFGLIQGSCLQAQSEEILFEQAVTTFRSGNYARARVQFEDVLARYPGGSKRSAAVLALTKCHYRSGHFKLARRAAKELTTRFPSSRYGDEALMVASLSAMYLGQMEDAWSSLIALRFRSAESRSTVDSHLTAIVRMAPLSEARDLIRSLNKSEIQDALNLEMANRLVASGHVTSARRLLESLEQSKHKSIAKKASSMIKSLRSRFEGTVRIGVITSLSGGNAEAGEAIRRGLELAVGQHNIAGQPRIELLIYDDGSDVMQAIEAARDLVTMDDVSLIIGPIDSDPMAAVAVVCEQARVPVISPTAAKTGLSDLGSWVFQANPDLNTRSAALADYAVGELKGKTFAILAPSDLYGEAAVKGFTAAVQKKGGRVLSVERFYENTQDFRSQLVAIRRTGLVDSVLEGRSSSLSRRQIDSVYALYFPPNPDQKEEFAAPMTHIDALYLPIYSDDIKYIAPQIAFYNLKTQLLGGDQWFDLTELRLQQNYVNGVVLVSESFVDVHDDATTAFLRDYKNQFGQEPKPEAIYSFDLMEFLIHTMMKENAYTSDEIQAELAKGVDWTGIHGRIVWPKLRRSNQSVHILKFEGGYIVHLN